MKEQDIIIFAAVGLVIWAMTQKGQTGATTKTPTGPLAQSQAADTRLSGTLQQIMKMNI